MSVEADIRINGAPGHCSAGPRSRSGVRREPKAAHAVAAASKKESPAIGRAKGIESSIRNVSQSRRPAAKMRRSGTALGAVLKTQFDCCPFALAAV